MKNTNETLKKKLKHKELTIGSWITLGHPSIPEIMAKAGFDWLTVDMEHSAITLHQTQQLIQIIELSEVTPLVRVGENNPDLIKRVMDVGSHGVIVPMVNTKEDAIKAVNAVKYPPVGTRGVGLARAQGYGLEFEKYKEWVNRESIVIIQIEHIKAVNNLEEILAVAGVDGFIVGPYDLSGSIGRPGEFEHPDVIVALKRVREISEKMNVASGFHVIPPDYKDVLKKIKEGYSFIAFSLDTLFLGNTCREGLRKLKAECSELKAKTQNGFEL
jgi:2-dehydro-3-deoxyglucarate aldolase